MAALTLRWRSCSSSYRSSALRCERDILGNGVPLARRFDLNYDATGQTAVSRRIWPSPTAPTTTSPPLRTTSTPRATRASRAMRSTASPRPTAATGTSAMPISPLIAGSKLGRWTGGAQRWRGGGVRLVVDCFARARRCHDSDTAGRRPVSASAAGAGSARSARAIPTTATTSVGPTSTGSSATPSTGAATAALTLTTPAVTARSSAHRTAADAGPAPPTRPPPCLQRWTRQRRFPLCREALIGSFRFAPRRGLQRWTRGWLKSLGSQRVTSQLVMLAKRGLDSSGRAPVVTVSGS